MRESEAMEALHDVSDNNGVMWRARNTLEAKARWDELKRRGWVEFNPWAQRYLPTNAGRSVLAKDVR